MSKAWKTWTTNEMKSKKHSIESARFWQWFSAVADSLASNPENTEILAELDARITALNPNFSWEIGPGWRADWSLTISPNLDSRLLAQTEAIIASAPSIHGWQFESTRVRKNWDGQLEMERADGHMISMNALRWRYVLLQYPDGTIEILLQSKYAKDLDMDERWTAAAIALEGLLGERTLIRAVSTFDLLEEFEPQLEEKARPISLLPAALNIGN